MCARARLCAGGPPRSPVRPLLPPALHAAMPAESLTRAPTLRGAHSRARVHPSAAPPALHAPLALLGLSQRAGCPGPPGVPRARPAALAERTCDPFRAGLVSRTLGLPEGTPRASLLRHHAPPARGHAPSLNPSQAPNLGSRRSHPKAPTPSSPAPPPAAACSLAPFFPLFRHCPFFTSSLFSLSTPMPLPQILFRCLSRFFSRYVAAALSRALCYGSPCAASHILRITLGAARGSLGPELERSVGGEGIRCAPALPSPPLSTRFAAPLGLTGGDVPR